MSLSVGSALPSASEAPSEDSAGPANNPQGDGQSSSTRAVKACRRCHRKKLKCHGGCPCVSCKRAHQSCDFGFEPSTEKYDRLARLEKLVETLVGHMSSPKQLPPPTPPTPLTSNIMDLGSLIGEPSIQHGWTGAPGLEDFLSPSVLAGSASSIPPVPRPSFRPQREDERPHNTPESRLAMSQAPSQHRAPFRALAFHPAHWEERDRTRPPSPVPAPITSEKFWDLSDVGPGLSNDPIYAGIIDLATAETLLDFFLQYCHPFLPILDFVRPPHDRLSELREMGPYLSTTVLAVASRYRPKTASRSTVILPELSDKASLGIRQLAYAHFASSSLRRHQNLRDIQATLLLAGWGCHPTSEGPESWMSTGRCGRLASRLGLHRLSSRLDQSGGLRNMARTERIKFLERYKTWLGLWCLDTTIELGFGRPTTTMPEPDETALLEAIDSSPVPVDDEAPVLYLISLTRLNRIARNFYTWLQTRDDKERSIVDVQSMLAHFNRELDAWFRSWIWKGARHHLRLKRFTRELKLRSEHLRLAINSIVLSSTDEWGMMTSGSLGTASMAALELIQACVDNAEGDQYLTFALDCIYFIFGHALIFLIRLYLHADPLPIDRTMILHYLSVGIDTLNQTDLSINDQASHIARTCKDLCKAGGVPLDGDTGGRNDDHPFTFLPSDGDLFADAMLMPDMGASDQYGTEWLLGLPGLGMVTGYES